LSANLRSAPTQLFLFHAASLLLAAIADVAQHYHEEAAAAAPL